MRIRASAKGPSRLHYYPEIDGLRAIAILLVVLYHLRVPGFQGGFIGVDVFFAISGFLIFSILNRELETRNHIDWLAFFARRVTRLVPEATAMIIVIMLIGQAVLLPLGAAQVLAKSGIAGALWAGNIYFWRYAGGYFDFVAERQPLLHLWSLGLEEQFYVTVPAMFVLAAWISKNLAWSWRKAVVVLLAGSGFCSLAIAVWASYTEHAVAAFYLLPTRAYEFVIGAGAAVLITGRRTSQSPSAFSQVPTALGIVGTLVSVLVFSRGLKVPSAWALLPSASASLLLMGCAASELNLAKIVLSKAPLVHLGRISYGWYLWHFPLLVLWREQGRFDTSIWSETVVVLLALIPAIFGYMVVSRFRNPAAVSTPIARNLKYCALAIAGAIAISGMTGAEAKYVGAASPEMKLLVNELDDFYKPGDECFSGASNPEARCEFGDPSGTVTLVIWGDSHANHWVPTLDATFRALGIRGLERAKPACPPVVVPEGFSEDFPTAGCIAFNRAVIHDLAVIGRSQPVGVILSARWGLYFGKVGPSIAPIKVPDGLRFHDMLDRAARNLNALNIPAGVILQVPEQRLNPPICAQESLIERCEIASHEEEAYLTEVQNRILRVASLEDATVLDPSRFLCGPVRCFVQREGVLLYMDENHLSARGAKLLAPFLRDFATRMRNAALGGALTGQEARHSHGTEQRAI